MRSEFTAARVVKSSPAFDYNIARCHDRLERVAAAIEWYERFLEHAPDGPEQVTARERLGVLRARAVVAPPAVVVVDPAEHRAWRPRYKVALPAALAAVGATSLVVGGALYRMNDCGADKPCFSDTWGHTRTIERAGIGLMMTGGVVGAASIGLWSARRAR